LLESLAVSVFHIQTITCLGIPLKLTAYIHAI